ncbi:hypothetical protein GCM10009675_29280 [Prauserella alba]|uniref:Uncharacterized protein n=1 Tax=Prauserella alba TaxID=176898 RepID=A0ABN1VEF8_9PSEU
MRASTRCGRQVPEVERLVAAWQLLLRMHERTGDGACRVCGPGRDHRLCTVWQVAVGYFLRRLPNESPVERRSAC